VDLTVTKNFNVTGFQVDHATDTSTQANSEIVFTNGSQRRNFATVNRTLSTVDNQVFSAELQTHFTAMTFNGFVEARTWQTQSVETYNRRISISAYGEINVFQRNTSID